MVQAIVVIQQAKDKYSLEKRYGRTREDFEQDLVGNVSVMPLSSGVLYGLGVAMSDPPALP